MPHWFSSCGPITWRALHLPSCTRQSTQPFVCVQRHREASRGSCAWASPHCLLRAPHPVERRAPSQICTPCSLGGHRVPKHDSGHLRNSKTAATRSHKVSKLLLIECHPGPIRACSAVVLPYLRCSSFIAYPFVVYPSTVTTVMS